MPESVEKVDYMELRKWKDAPYYVQWVTEAEETNFRVVGYCVRKRNTWDTVFEHKDANVCQKIADMLNEGEVTNVRGT